MLDIFDDPSVWRMGPKPKPKPRYQKRASGSSKRSAPTHSSHSRRSLRLLTTSSCSPAPSLHRTKATTPHPMPGKPYRIPKMPYHLRERGRRIIQEGCCSQMPRGVKRPMLEWTVKVVGLKGVQNEVWTADWEGITALRERIATAEGIYPPRRLKLSTWPEEHDILDGWTVSESDITSTTTLVCSMRSLAAREPSTYETLPDPPLAVPTVSPTTSYPEYIDTLPTHTTDGLLTLYASILTYHFPPLQSFQLHSFKAPGIQPGLAVYHPLHEHPLLVLSPMPPEEFGVYAVRSAHIRHLLGVCGELKAPRMYALSIFGTHWRALKALTVNNQLETAPVTHVDAARPVPAQFPCDCSTYTWADSLLSKESFESFSTIASDLKVYYLPHWTGSAQEIIVRLPQHRIVPSAHIPPFSSAANGLWRHNLEAREMRFVNLFANAWDNCAEAHGKEQGASPWGRASSDPPMEQDTPSLSASTVAPEDSKMKDAVVTDQQETHWLDAPEVIEIFPVVDPETKHQQDKRYRVRLPRRKQ